ncbi:BZ3501_MvSof-1269-A2-R1_Chr8-1g09561 [Microbotryum saponariae]|nr:BZ3501_MvSof-1269-A2-R1_Chr8-1g09561 [Microbotryum saponariae]
MPKHRLQQVPPLERRPPPPPPPPRAQAKLLGTTSSPATTHTDLAPSSLAPPAPSDGSTSTPKPTRSRAVSLVQSDPLDAISSGSAPTRSPSRPLKRGVDTSTRTRAETIPTTPSAPPPRPLMSSRERSSSTIPSSTSTMASQPEPVRPAQSAPGIPPRPSQSQTPHLRPTITDPLTSSASSPTPRPHPTDSLEQLSTATFPGTSSQTPISPGAPRLPPRRTTTTSSSTSTLENRPVPALPPRPRSVDPVPSVPARREAPPPPPTTTRSAISVRSRSETSLARQRYTALFDLLIERFGTVDSPTAAAPGKGPRWIPKQNNGVLDQGEGLDGRVVRSVWLKSRLEDKVMESIW